MDGDFKIESNQCIITGVPGIDAQHKEIFTMLDNLIYSIENGNPFPYEIFNCVHEIFGKMRAHIATEESLMEMIEFPEVAEHKAQHNNLFNMVAEESKMLKNTDNAKISRFLHSYKHIALTHMTVFDREYVDHIEKFKASRKKFRKNLPRGEAIAG